MTTATAPDGIRPGAAYFSPGVQIFCLGELTAGPQSGTALAPDVLADVQQVEVTLVANGASQYSITLNNWYTTTEADRASPHRDGVHGDRGAHVHDWPRFKYNDFSLLMFGQRLRIDMRYWPDTPPSPGRGVSNRWVPMVAGPITDMQFNFGDGGSTVVVSGEDDLSRLKDGVLARQELGARPERELVAEALNRAEYPLRPAEPKVAWPSFAESGDAPAESITDGQSYLEFLQRIADRLDLEVFIDFVSLNDVGSGVQLHVEPARSALSPDDAGAETYVLERGLNLLSYSPSIKVVDQPSDVRVRGRNRDREIPEPVTQVAVPTAVDQELFPAGLSTGPAVRAQYFENRPNPLILPNETNLDDARGRHLAEVTLRKKAREFFTIDGSTIGLPRMRPGNYVEIKGMRPPFDGFFYVTKTVHTYGSDGYRTRFSARRPGMPLPPYTEA